MHFSLKTLIQHGKDQSKEGRLAPQQTQQRRASSVLSLGSSGESILISLVTLTPAASPLSRHNGHRNTRSICYRGHCPLDLSALQGALLQRDKSFSSPLPSLPPPHLPTPSWSITAETKPAAPSEGIIKVQRLWRGPGSVEQVFNFKLTRLGACAVGSLIGKTNGWPGSQGGEPEQVEGGRSKMGGQEASHVGKRGLPALEICLLSANPSCWHLPRQPRGMSTTSDADPAHPPTRQGAGRNPEGQASCPGSQSTPRGVETVS